MNGIRKKPKSRDKETPEVLRGTFDRLYAVSLCLASLHRPEAVLGQLIDILNPVAGIRLAILLQRRTQVQEHVWHAPDVSASELAGAKIRGANSLAYFFGEAPAGNAVAIKPRDTAVIIPLVVGGGGTFGVLQLDCMAVDETMVTFLHAVGSQLAVALDRQYQLEQQRRHQSSLRTADAANQAKSNFLANMSHEIRTPLGIMLGFTDLALRAGVSDVQRTEALETIKRNGGQLAQLVDELLDLSKIEAGRLEIDRMSVDLREILDDVISEMNLRAAEKGITVVLELAGTIQQRLMTDPMRLRQCLTNIIGNAVKFTHLGGVHVKVQEHNGFLEFAITDTGVGLSLPHQIKLFEPFTQADASTTRRFGGTGLGLVLSRKLARALGGDLYLAHSAMGKGSSFVLRIALDSSPHVSLNTPPDLIKPPERSIRLSGLKVLVVEDNPDNQMLVRSYLELAGASVGVASNGEEGVQEALAGSYDVVLMDIQMPGIDGYEAMARLSGRGYKQPVVALTANAMRGDREKSLAAGFSDHLSKPIDRELLLSVVKMVCGRATSS